MSPLPDEAAYVTAMDQVGGDTLRVEMTVVQLAMLLATLQLALRHPQYPERLRPTVERFMAGAIENLTRLSPVIGQMVAAGNDPAYDEKDTP